MPRSPRWLVSRVLLPLTFAGGSLPLSAVVVTRLGQPAELTVGVAGAHSVRVQLRPVASLAAVPPPTPLWPRASGLIRSSP